MRNGNRIVVRDCFIHNVSGSGIIMGGGSSNNTIERNLISEFGDRGILVGSDNTEPQYMDGAQLNPEWHDSIGHVIRNNIVSNGQGAGIAFYSARDCIAVQNTITDVAQTMHACLLFNLSPKLITQQVGTWLALRSHQLCSHTDVVE